MQGLGETVNAYYVCAVESENSKLRKYLGEKTTSALATKSTSFIWDLRFILLPISFYVNFLFELLMYERFGFALCFYAYAWIEYSVSFHFSTLVPVTCFLI